MYDYENERAKIFTEEGQEVFLQIRDNVKRILEIAGCMDMQHAIQSSSGDSWMLLACVDRLVELDEIDELHFGSCAGQHRVFRSTF